MILEAEADLGNSKPTILRFAIHLDLVDQDIAVVVGGTYSHVKSYMAKLTADYPLLQKAWKADKAGKEYAGLCVSLTEEGLCSMCIHLVGHSGQKIRPDLIAHEASHAATMIMSRHKIKDDEIRSLIVENIVKKVCEKLYNFP